jgi:2-polyprenyl-6-methoxyphenol hydroxylase-like FAD-dependent oxidoreductase
METFADWGALDALRDRGTFLSKVDPVDAATDRRLFCIDLTTMEPVSDVAGSLVIPQNITEDVLRERVRAEPACQLVVGRCAGIEQDAEGVTVTVAREGSEQRFSANYVVGADGARSTVRRALGVSLEGETHPQRMVLSDESVEDSRQARMRFAVREPGFLVGLRFGKDMWRLYSSIPKGMTDEQATHPDAVGDRVEKVFGHRRHETRWISTFNVHRRVASSYRVGRVLLAGDAAHLVSPIGGQGMNSGVLDAENLAWKLAVALSGGDEDALLDSYHVERHWAMTNEVAKRAARDTQVEFSAPPWIKSIIIRLTAGFLRLPRFQASVARTLSMLDLSYPNSPLLSGNHPMLGARLHDLRDDDGKRLSAGLKGKAGILECGTRSPSQGLSTDVNLPVLPFCLPPKSWKLGGPAALVVRPDRHVGAVVSPPHTTSVSAAARHALGLGTTRALLRR